MTRIPSFLAALTTLIVAPALAMPMGGETAFRPGTYVGGAQIVGNGSAYSWVRIGAGGKPTSIGIALTETALEGLPKMPPPGKTGTEYVLALPRQASATPFTHLVINWNPFGHLPPGIYDVPHFDFHFYSIAPEARMKITAKGADLKICQKKVPAAYLPKGYVYAPGAEEAMMGAHWADIASPEFHHQPFTRTFIYGSYAGKVAFYEPMAALSYLKTKPNATDAIKRPDAYLKSGYYPATYSIRYDPARHEYLMELKDFAWRAGSVKAEVAENSPLHRGSRADSMEREMSGR